MKYKECSPISISEAFKLGSQQTHEGGAQAASRDQVLSHQGRKQVNVQGCAIESGTQITPEWE